MLTVLCIYRVLQMYLHSRDILLTLHTPAEFTIVIFKEGISVFDLKTIKKVNEGRNNILHLLTALRTTSYR